MTSTATTTRSTQSTTVLWPVTADRVCLALSPRSTIHASADAPMAIARSKHGNLSSVPVRTLCGSDAFLLAHGTNQANTVVISPWPPPKLDRCPDCERLDGHRLPARGCPHWQSLKPVPEPS